MGLGGANHGVLSHVLDLVVGAIAAVLAWVLYEQTGQTVWSLLLLIGVAVGMVWWRTRRMDTDV